MKEIVLLPDFCILYSARYLIFFLETITTDLHCTQGFLVSNIYKVMDIRKYNGKQFMYILMKLIGFNIIIFK